MREILSAFVNGFNTGREKAHREATLRRLEFKLRHAKSKEEMTAIGEKAVQEGLTYNDVYDVVNKILNKIKE